MNKETFFELLKASLEEAVKHNKSVQETQHLLATEANKKRLLESVEQYKINKGDK